LDDAAAPDGARHMMKSVLAAPNGQLRIAGIVSAVIGVLIVWLIRG